MNQNLNPVSWNIEHKTMTVPKTKTLFAYKRIKTNYYTFLDVENVNKKMCKVFSYTYSFKGEERSKQCLIPKM